MGVTDFIDFEIKCLLKDRTIRRRKSPKIIWVVVKKGTDVKGAERVRKKTYFTVVSTNSVCSLRVKKRKEYLPINVQRHFE